MFILIAIVAFIWKVARDKTFFQDEITQRAAIVPLIDPLERTIESSIEKPLSQYLNRITHVVKPGDTFLGILSEYELDIGKADDVHKSMKSLGLSALFPGDSVILQRKTDGSISQLSLLSKSLCWYKVFLNDTLIKAEKHPVKVSTYTCLINGTLETSISEEIQNLGVSDVITGKFADIFAWDVNFFIDPRKGDSFQILFEQKFAEGKLIGYGEILAAKYTNEGHTFYAFGFRDSDSTLRYYDENGKAVQKQFLKAPLRFSRISSGFTFKRRHPVLGIVRPHLGVDYAAPTGTPVSAAADGKVQFAGTKGGFGKLIVLSHGGSYETSYGHLQKIIVRQGSFVRQGDMIGTVGSTGLSTGPHLDYRMKRNQQFVNPNTISLPSRESITQDQHTLFQKIKRASMVAFETRFSHQDGFYVLDIDQPETTDIVVKQISQNTGTSDVKSTGN